MKQHSVPDAVRRGTPTSSSSNTPKSDGPFAVLRARLGRNRGGTLVEFGMLAGLIAVVSIGAVAATGGKVSDVFCNAAGEMDEAMGGAGFCLWDIAERGHPILDQEGPGVSGASFSDIAFDQGDTSNHDVMLRFERGLAAATQLSIGSSAAAIEACYRMDGPGTPLNCSAFDSDAGTSQILAPEGADALGYRVALPADVAADFDTALTIAASGGDFSDSWQISATRPPLLPDFEVGFAFTDESYERYTTGEQIVMEPLTGSYGSPMSFSVLPSGTRPFALCLQATSGDDPVCGAASTTPAPIAVQPSDYALGYSFTLPGNAGQYFMEGLSISLTDGARPERSASWDVDVYRTPSSEPFYTSITFDDQIFEAGYNDATATYFYEALDGDFEKQLTLTTDGNGVAIVRPCYFDAGGQPVNCAAWNSGNNGVRSVAVPANAAYIGYHLDISNRNTDIDTPIGISLAYSDEPEISQSWTPQISRPPYAPGDMTALVMDFPETIDRPMSFVDSSEVWLSDINDQFGTDRVYLKTTGASNIPVRPCWRTAGGNVNCEPYKTGEQYGHIYNPANQAAVGFQIDFSGKNPDYDGDITLEIGYWDYPSAGTKTYTVHVTRPGYQPESFLTANETVFTDHTYPEGLTNYAADEAFVMVPLQGAFTEQLELVTNGKNQLNMHPCKWATPTSDPVCNWGWTNRTKALTVNASDYAVGYRAHVGQSGNIEADVEISLYYKNYPAEKAVFPIHITRIR